MKKITFLLLPGLAFLQFTFNLNHHGKDQPINTVINDISFVHKFGCLPNSATDEGLRIKTHLEYVENILRQKNIPGLSPELYQKRARLLDLLHKYWIAGIFPRNYDFKETRKPCFIDKNNRICAVGYLIEQTTGRQIAEDINKKHQYETITAMNDTMVDGWIKESGFSKEECAMIQPNYGPNLTPSNTPNNYIEPAFGISSAVLGGLNFSLTAINSIQLLNGTNKKTIPITGLISGAGQIILGASNFPKTTTGFYGNTTNESKKALSMVNIGLGTTTMILSAWNLITNKKHKDKKLTWQINNFKTPTDIGLAFTLKQKF